ncbi:MAG: type II toxin-antitoxin system prevent-host-death family antitoxin [Accumulibacter sp.]|jgi:prevent-host-death family protein|uniref:type II toxin-antitoxin system Phd/YefM family antitoxin n=1 Tax=Accumulibacter sp. TaxID=2053492 RepID=UPI002FC3150D
MRTVAVFEAKNRLSELLNAVERGEEVTITRHGNPVARIVSVNAATSTDGGQSARVSAAITRLRTLGSGATLGTTLVEAIAKGRD